MTYSDTGNPEEDALFWFVLADTQWNYGRLLPMVLEKALFYLPLDSSRERWLEKGERELKAWNNTLERLEERLLAPQPQEKKIPKSNPYRCGWRDGDVFAYQLLGEESVKRGFSGKYIAFQKIGECRDWPDNIIPVVKIYDWLGEEVPSLELLSSQRYLPSVFAPIVYLAHPAWPIDCRVKLYISSKKSLPKEGLYPLGNIPTQDIPHMIDALSVLSGAFLKKKGAGSLERLFIEQFSLWNDSDALHPTLKERI